MKAPLILTVMVTRKDIKNGVPGSARSCPIALALRRKYGDDPTVSSDIAILFEDGFASYGRGWAPTQFISRFDRREFGFPRPFVFVRRWIKP